VASTRVRDADYVALSEIRYRIRTFLTFSEEAAREVGLEPQQHQLLLAIRGLARGDLPTIGKIAERLQIQHHSAVELVRRAYDNGLVVKRSSERDGREVLLEITTRGERLLERLAASHRTELRSMARSLIAALGELVEGAEA